MDIEKLYQTYLQCNGVSTDTRQLQQGSLFFCLKGDNFDGNKFAAQAIEKGAKYAVTDDKQFAAEGKTILVDNTLEALQQLARYHRQQLNIPVLGITGTNGKTTTKELVNAVLSQKLRVVATQGNLNNHIGVPLTLLSINAKDTQLAIVEMGANHRGEIAQLCEISMPNYGIITNIGKAHIEGFGSQEGIIETKKALYDYVGKEQGTLFVNHDDALLMDLSSAVTRLTYGTGQDADVRGVCNAQKLYMTFKLPQFNRTISTQLVGAYNFNNAMAAVAAG
ncbi:MAG: UDP-N-acetylmuramoyl-tripeptide--D-alanyl-D-alanine ligase, partial [Bacteroidales bacterium]|nr:UDP-N-acetylmuramoyl-tripeptide--D-alanyl-D-alanine ligase [Bacteroidales bacterium]